MGQHDIRRVLVTGGTGYIGRYLVEALERAGYAVTITSRRAVGAVRWLDLLELETASGVCAGMDAVVHLANLDEKLVKTRPREALLANAYGTRQVYLDACACGCRRFVYFSTFHVYGRSAGEIDEATPVTPQADYGLTHFFAEEYLRQLAPQEGVPVQAVRLTNGVGAPRGDYKWYLALNDFCRSAFLTQRITLLSNGLPQRDFIPIADVAEAVVTLLRSEAPSPFEIYNVSNEETISIRDLALRVQAVYAERYGRTASIEMPSVTQAEIDAVQPLYVHSQKIRALGWRPQHTIDDVIGDIFDALEAQGKDEVTHA